MIVTKRKDGTNRTTINVKFHLTFDRFANAVIHNLRFSADHEIEALIEKGTKKKFDAHAKEGLRDSGIIAYESESYLSADLENRIVERLAYLYPEFRKE